MRKITIVLICCLPFISFAATINQTINLSKAEYFLNSNNTYQLNYTEERTLVTPLGVKEGQNTTISYSPDLQSLKLLSAYVIQPSGKKILITKANYFLRPSATTQEAPGFSNSMTLTVLFPQVIPGSKTFIEWQLTQKKPNLFGINILDFPELETKVDNEKVIIHMPNNFPLHWGKYGDYQVTQTSSTTGKMITATLKNKPAQTEEDFMPAVSDVEPVFAASTLSSWEQLGKIYWNNSKDKAAVTPQISSLAKKIVGTKTGYAAAQALYDWVSINIEYVAVYLNDAAGYVPHSANEVLNNGYGDCKDHVVLLQALLKAIGIDSYPTLISWDNSFRVLPVATSSQFNHVILYIPEFKLFANPTSPYSSFGSYDVLLSNKMAVIAGPTPTVSKTPGLMASANNYLLNNQMNIDNAGNVNGNNIIHFQGNLNDNARHLIGTTPSLHQLANALLANTLAGGTGDMNTSNISDLDHDMLVKDTWTSLYGINIQSSTYFIAPTGVDFYHPQILRNFVTTAQREFPIILNPATFTWHSDINIPKGFLIIHTPEDIHISNNAGSYYSFYNTKDNVIHITRKLVINDSLYDATKYEELKILLYKAIMDAQNVFVMKQ